MTDTDEVLQQWDAETHSFDAIELLDALNEAVAVANTEGEPFPSVYLWDAAAPGNAISKAQLVACAPLTDGSRCIEIRLFGAA